MRRERASSLGRPRLRADLIIAESSDVGETTYILKDPTTQKFVQFRPEEQRLLALMDGSRTWSELADKYFEIHGQSLAQASIGKFIDYLARNHLLEKTAAERNLVAYEKVKAMSGQRWSRLGGTGSILYRRWHLFDPDRLFSRLVHPLAVFWTPVGVMLGLMLCTVAVITALANWSRLSSGITVMLDFGNLPLSTFIGLWVLSTVISVIHEFAHGLTCKRFGGEVHDMGLLLLFFQPTMYCNVNDAWLMKSRAHKMNIAFAGGYIELLIAAVAIIGWWLTDDGSFLNQFFLATAAISSIASILFNFNPLIKLDGYYALVDYLDFPNLYEESRNYVKATLKRAFFNTGVVQETITPRRRRIMKIYGTLSLAYTTALILILTYFGVRLLTEKFGGAGWILAAGAIGFWLVRRIRPIILTYLAGRNANLSTTRSVNRWVLWTAAALVLFCAWPTRYRFHTSCKAVPITSRFVLAEQHSVVSEVVVRQGDRVDPGDVLLISWSDSLVAESELAAIGLETAINPQALATGDIADSIRAVLTADFRRRSTHSADIRVGMQQLRVSSRWAGVLIEPDPILLTGRSVAPGDTLLRIGDEFLAADFAVSPAAMDLVDIGRSVSVVWDADPGVRYSGIISRISESPDSSGRFNVRVSLPNPPRYWIAGADGEIVIAGSRAPVGWRVANSLYRSFRHSVWWDIWPF
jgi:putative peptide zinc metalloprotease protein